MTLKQTLCALLASGILASSGAVAKAGDNPCENISKTAQCNVERFGHYQSLVKKRVDTSWTMGRDLIVVDKSAGEMDLYLRGDKVATYKISTGRSGIGDRENDDDNHTPEGMYRLENIFDYGALCNIEPCQSLVIDFPNYEDVKRVKKAKDNKNNKSYRGRNTFREKIMIEGTNSEMPRPTKGHIQMTNKDLTDLLEKVKFDKEKSVGVLIVPYGARESYQR